MPKIFFAAFFFSLFVFFFLFSIPTSVMATGPSATPTPTGVPTCDACGWCNKDINPTPPPNWASCHNCLIEPTTGAPRDRTYYTVLGCFSTDPSGGPFVRSVLSIIFGMAGGTAFLMVLWGSAMVLTSSGDPVRLQSGKETIVSSVAGILLILFSTFLLSVIGVDILKIPGFGK